MEDTAQDRYMSQVNDNLRAIKEEEKQMETQENLETVGIGDKEALKLNPTRVKIVKASVVAVGEKGNNKVVCEVEHPAKKDGTIQISAAKVEIKNSLKVSGLWFNTDEDNRIRKGSALALFLQKVGASNISELAAKEVDTIEDDNGYLAFKGY